MKTLLFVVVVLAVIAVIAAAAKRGTQRVKDLRKKQPLTDREQGMYWRLLDVFPPTTHVVLSQVSFSALITSRQQATRNVFNRKFADFVICSTAFQVQAVIELDDASHKGKEGRDAQRDEMLRTAGYRVFRYANIPDAEKLRRDFAPPPPLSAP
jgi:very-short-patch-repair endonuclease